MSVVRKSVLSVAGAGALSAANLGIGVLLARWLSPDGLGQYALVAPAATLSMAAENFPILAVESCTLGAGDEPQVVGASLGWESVDSELG